MITLHRRKSDDETAGEKQISSTAGFRQKPGHEKARRITPAGF
ncbi:hypothetical protein ACFQY0_00085 [Haloferula chungangensis]|uniref:Uncharacterized protein n=1 Tax=Haloferula chungangensis TaxID=1048331 RepID=A0ABW2L314_9BACT